MSIFPWKKSGHVRGEIFAFFIHFNKNMNPKFIPPYKSFGDKLNINCLMVEEIGRFEDLSCADPENISMGGGGGPLRNIYVLGWGGGVLGKAKFW